MLDFPILKGDHINVKKAGKRDRKFRRESATHKHESQGNDGDSLLIKPNKLDCRKARL